MTASTLDRLATLTNLRLTWREFWRQAHNQHSSGVDGVTPADFFRHLDRNLARLHGDLREGYKFSLLRAHPVPKKDGRTFRIICVPTVRDRIVQRLLGAHLTEKSDKLGIINECSFGFIRSSENSRRGVDAARDRALELRSRHKWAYKSDISSFFDRVPREEAVRRTIGTLHTRSLEKILLGAVSCEIDDTIASVSRIASENGIRRGRGIRQGMPLSPILSNIVLRPFDEAMTRRGYQLVRYADDFIVFADSQKECLEIDIFARKILLDLNFDLPPLGDSKTYIADPNNEIEFLGLAPKPRADGAFELAVTQRQLEKIKRDLGQLKDVHQLLHDNVDITTLYRRLDNKIAGYSAAYHVASNYDAVERSLQSLRSEILNTVFARAFTAAGVQKLPLSYRRFFCLTAASAAERFVAQ